MATTQVTSGMIGPGEVKTPNLAPKAVTTSEMGDGTEGQVLGYGAAGAAEQQWPSHVQRAVGTNATWTTLTDQRIPGDDTVPQKTEGQEILTASITPKAAGHILRVTIDIPIVQTNALATITGVLFWDGGTGTILADGIACHMMHAGSGENQSMSFAFEVAAVDTNPHNFSVRLGHAQGTAVNMYLNGNNTSRMMGGTSVAIITIDEFKA